MHDFQNLRDLILTREDVKMILSREQKIFRNEVVQKQ